MLEGVLDKLATLDRKMAGLEDAEQYNALVDQFNALRKEAIERKDMLMIHREAIGLWKHHDIDICYPIPPRKRKKLHDHDD
jgi:hypothetical protein